MLQWWDHLFAARVARASFLKRVAATAGVGVFVIGIWRSLEPPQTPLLVRKIGSMPSLDNQTALLEQLQSTLGSARQPKLTDDRFDKAHELFETSSNQQQLILEWLTDFSIQHLCDGSLKMLSVGCGSGILDNPLLRALAGSQREIAYTGIDPNPVACDRFRKEFSELKLAQVQLEVREETVESLSGHQSFDIIHAVHSLYYFKAPADAIGNLRNRLNTNGNLVIFQAPMAELNQLADCFWFNDHDVDIWFSGKLEKHLLEVDIDFESTRINAQVDASRCFDATSHEGAMILDFITQVDCRELTPVARERLLNYLKSIAEIDGDRILVPHPVDVFTIKANR